MTFLSCVIAVYNAGAFIEEKIRKIVNFLEKNYPEYELIIVDDGSRDNTLEILNRINLPRLKIFRLKNNLGQGAALKLGMLLTRGKFAFYTDIDLSTSIDNLPFLIKELENNADVAIGSRWNRQAIIKADQPNMRKILGKIFYLIINTFFLKEKISDTNCGFKAYKGEIAKVLYGYVRCWRWAFNVEHLFLAQKLGLKIKEIPVEWSHNTKSKVKVLRDVIFTIWELILIKIRTLWGAYPRLLIK